MNKIIISLIMISAVAVSAIGATRAYFSDTLAVNNNTFAAGTVDLDPAHTSGLPITLTNLGPGISQSKDVEIRYRGSLNADLYLGVGGNLPTNDDRYIADHLWLKIIRPSDSVVIWEGWAQYLSTHWIGIGANLTQDQLMQYKIQFTLANDTPNNHQGVSNTDTIFYLYAVQTGQPAPTTAPYLGVTP